MADGSVTVRFTLPFKRRFKSLANRYRQIQQDIQPMIEQLQSGVFLGDQISGTDYTVFKVRVKNSDIPVGKSGGYRVIYQVLSPDALLLLIYAKSDQADVTTAEIEAAVVEAIHESWICPIPPARHHDPRRTACANRPPPRLAYNQSIARENEAMSPLLQQVLQELAQLSAEEQLEVIAQATSHLKRRSVGLLSSVAQVETTTADPLLGLFSGSANLATQSEDILQQEISARSGWSWKL